MFKRKAVLWDKEANGPRNVTVTKNEETGDYEMHEGWDNDAGGEVVDLRDLNAYVVETSHIKHPEYTLHPDPDQIYNELVIDVTREENHYQGMHRVEYIAKHKDMAATGRGPSPGAAIQDFTGGLKNTFEGRLIKEVPFLRNYNPYVEHITITSRLHIDEPAVKRGAFMHRTIEVPAEKKEN